MYPCKTPQISWPLDHSSFAKYRGFLARALRGYGLVPLASMFSAKILRTYDDVALELNLPAYHRDQSPPPSHHCPEKMRYFDCFKRRTHDQLSSEFDSLTTMSQGIGEDQGFRSAKRIVCRLTQCIERCWRGSELDHLVIAPTPRLHLPGSRVQAPPQ